jgi:hypothetical protein
MSTTQPIDRPTEMVRRTKEDEILSLLFVIATCLLTWLVVAAVNYGEQERECRAWVAQQQDQEAAL